MARRGPGWLMGCSWGFWVVWYGFPVHHPPGEKGVPANLKEIRPDTVMVSVLPARVLF